MSDTKKILLITIFIMSFAVAAQWGLRIAVESGQGSTSYVKYANAREERLFDAVRAGDTAKISKMLRRHRSDIDATYDRHACFSAKMGISLLHAAIGRPKVVKLLLEFDADPNKTDWVGRTPLMDAAASGRIETMKILLEHGARTDFKTQHSGLTAADNLKNYIARYKGNSDEEGLRAMQDMLTRLTVVKEK